VRHIVVVEDEEDIADLVALHLRREGYRVTLHGDGEEAWHALDRRTPELVVLDLMLPGIDGLEICRRMRRSERLRDVPILILTARGEDADVVTGLELGADDYVTKPFSPRVLVARIRALLRRAENGGEDSEVLRVGPIEIDAGRHEIRVDGRLLDPTHSEFQILEFLARRPGRVRGREEILEAIGERSVLARTVDVHVGALRKKLGEAGERLETVRGVGYRLRER
jgi:DNA-binding response OmpR family regulator